MIFIFVKKFIWAFYSIKESDHYKYIFGDVYFKDYKGKINEDLEFVYGSVYFNFEMTSLEKIKNLYAVQGSATFYSDTIFTKFNDFGKLKIIGRNLKLEHYLSTI